MVFFPEIACGTERRKMKIFIDVMRTRMVSVGMSVDIPPNNVHESKLEPRSWLHTMPR